VIFDDLRAIQLRHGFLPKAELEGLSQRTQTPLYQIHSVAKFLSSFSSRAATQSRDSRLCGHELPPQRRMRVACRSRALFRQFTARRRADSATFPAWAVAITLPPFPSNDHIFTDVTRLRIAEEIARGAIRGEEVQEPHPEQARIACKADPYIDGEKYVVARKLIQSKAWDDVLAQLKAAELKGMGGAGFPPMWKMGPRSQAA